MNAPAHIIFGATCYMAAEPAVQLIGYENFHLSAEHFGTAVLFAIIADIDLKQSWAGQSSGMIGRIIRLFSGGHRQLTHKWILPLIVAVIGYQYYGYTFASAVVIGAYSHRILDIKKKPSKLLQKIFIEVMSIVLLVVSVYRLVH